MTFSIAARCARTGQLGIAIASSSPAVAARCAHVRAGIGVVATQNVTDPRLGPAGLDRLQSGLDAPGALAALQRDAPHLPHRQLAIVDRHGGSAVFSGARALGTAAARAAPDAAAAGNLLARASIVDAMLAAFRDSTALPLGTRLLHALTSGLDEGGEAGPVHSAGLLLAETVPWPVADLRVDWHDAPIAALSALWTLWQPQMPAYVQRALDPDAAPGYGVPGDVRAS